MTYWNLVTQDASAWASVDEATRELHVSITDGGPHPNAVQINQKGIDLVKGNDYEATFIARSNEPRTIQVDFRSQDGTTSYSGPQTVELTPKMDEKTVTFTMPETVTDVNGQFVFDLGGQNGDVFIDNVVLKVKGMQPPAQETSTAGIDNGTFDQGTDHWSSWWGDQWSGYAGGTYTVENGQLKVEISQVGGATYSPQVYQKDLLFEKGASYTVEFDAKADIARKVNVNIGKELSSDPWFTAYAPTQTFDLTSEMKRFSFTFTMMEETFSDGKIVFELGNISGGNAATAVYLDNVRVTKN
ncbi:carbohydrate binding domain-containing protein [Neobacillus sp. SM06]|uniref:carbohydrate binding domain-containing protein n=1 Tax=Neobacillus sp. SM06 TaxID=3422492 RepID=UPI003D264ECF